MSNRIRISEIFQSIEGEGPNLGRPTLFVRTYGCNFTCAGFSNPGHLAKVDSFITSDLRSLDDFEYIGGCDSIYSWHPAYKHLTTWFTVDELIKELADSEAQILSITGGEPLLHQDFLTELLLRDDELSHFNKILIETNGSVVVSNDFINAAKNCMITIEFSISPKLSNSGEKRSIAINAKAIKKLEEAGFIYFKFVTSGKPEEIEEIKGVLDNYSETLPLMLNSDVWLMPEGAEKEQIELCQKQVVNACLANNWNFSPRMHVYIWGSKAGT